jgi:GAF domain-containing protein
VPIKRSNGSVLGTFGIYRREQGEPTSAELDTVQMLATTAGTAIERAAARR